MSDYTKTGKKVKCINSKWSWWSFNDYDLELVED